MYCISDALASIQWTTESIPPLGDAARRLLELTEDDRGDVRLLGLIAQQDPVLLGRVLSHANSAAVLPPGARTITSIDAAIRALGAAQTFATLFSTAITSSLLGNVDLGDIRRYLIKNSFIRWNTARSLSRFLSLCDEQASVLQLASLLEPLGIYAALLQEDPVADKVRCAIEDAIRNRLAPCSPAWGLEGYACVSAKIAAVWGTPERIVRAIYSTDTEDGRLVQAVDQLLRAKVRGGSQISALADALEADSRWAERSEKEIDLVRIE